MIVFAEYWSDGPQKIMGLHFGQYLCLMAGLFLVGWLIADRWFRKK